MSSVVIVDDQGVNRKVLTSLAATLEADVQVKGEGASAGYALERAISTIVACRAAER